MQVENFGKFIYSSRVCKEMTREQLAEKSGFKEEQIEAWENGADITVREADIVLKAMNEGTYIGYYVPAVAGTVPVKNRNFIFDEVGISTKEEMDLYSRILNLNNSFRAILRNLPSLKGEAYQVCRPAFLAITDEVDRYQTELEKTGEELKGCVLRNEASLKNYLFFEG